MQRVRTLPHRGLRGVPMGSIPSDLGAPHPAGAGRPDALPAAVRRASPLRRSADGAPGPGGLRSGAMPGPGLLRKTYALPAEHGSWVWWLGPFVIGAVAGGHPRGDLVALLVAATAGFLAHGPLTVAVKAATGRRPPRDLRPALVWAAGYAAVAVLAVPCLLVHGHARVLLLLGPAALVFGAHLVLVARRAERRQRLLQTVGASGLALAAPAAYWVCGGRAYPEPWVLWLLCSLQAAATIASVHAVLSRRPADGPTTAARRLRGSALAIALAVVGVAVAAALSAVRHAPRGAALPMALVVADVVHAALRVPPGTRPARVGVRQAVASALFVAAMAATWA